VNNKDKRRVIEIIEEQQQDLCNHHVEWRCDLISKEISKIIKRIEDED